MNILLQVFVLTDVINCLLHIPQNGIVGPYGISMFSILRNCQTVFHSSYTILDSQQQCIMVLISPHPCQHLFLSVFFIIDMLFGMKWYFIVIFICISLITNDVENTLMCLLSICIFSLEKCLLKSFVHIGLCAVVLQGFFIYSGY